MKRSIIAAFLVGSLLTAQSWGFGTGSHFDLTRNVLAEHDFHDTPIKIVQVENWLTDYYTTSPTYVRERRDVLEKLHFDNLYDAAQVRAYWAFLLQNLKSATEKAARTYDPVMMFVVLGIGLHAVQDFYSHSNWAEIHIPADGEFLSITYIGASRSADKLESLTDLRTGKYPDDRSSGPGPFPVPANAAQHGSNRTGLNKDSPLRTGWDNAYIFAYAASHELVSAMEKWAENARPGFWKRVREYVADAENAERLEVEIEASRNISMWLEGKGQDGIWKGEGSGSSRFFAAFSSRWLGSEPSDYLKALREGRIQDDLTAGLYTKTSPPPLPDIEPFSLDRTAVIIKITYIAEDKERSLKSRLFTTSGSDFYSRITIGPQEFWGRTLQHSRTSSDAWYEIYFTDAKTEELPITFSVWDEDNIDWKDDQHVDINPKPGIYDLKSVYRMSDGAISGDVTGIFDSPDKPFLSKGAKPEERRAIIRGFVTHRRVR